MGNSQESESLAGSEDIISGRVGGPPYDVAQVGEYHGHDSQGRESCQSIEENGNILVEQRETL